jgi:hypothetical protein
MKPTITFVLILALVVPASARGLTPLEQARKMAPRSSIIVKLKNKQTLVGTLGEVGEDRFVLEPLLYGYGDWTPGKSLMFEEVTKIGPYKPRWSIKDILLIPAAVVYLGIFCLMSS